MKKFLTLFCSMLLVVIITGCNREKVDIEDVKIDFSMGHMLNNRVKVNANLQKASVNPEHVFSEGYFRLTKSINYLQDLIWNTNNAIDNSTSNREFVNGETIVHNNYQSTFEKGENNHIKLTIKNTDYKQTVELEKYSEKGTVITTGKNNVNGNVFSFTFKGNEEFTANYNAEVDHSQSYAHFIDENGILKGKIIFNNSEYDYNLYFVMNDNHTAVYYDFTSISENNHVFEVYDSYGNPLYVSMSLKNNQIKGTGWHLNALNGVDGNETVDNNSFQTIKMNYLTQDLKRIMKETLILGDLSYTNDFSIVQEVKAPFVSQYSDGVKAISKLLNSYYKTEINK